MPGLTRHPHFLTTKRGSRIKSAMTKTLLVGNLYLIYRLCNKFLTCSLKMNQGNTL